MAGILARAGKRMLEQVQADQRGMTGKVLPLKLILIN